MWKLLELDPAAWLRFLHVPLTDPDRVRVIDSNVSTITAETDKILCVDDDVLMVISERLVRETSPEQAATLWAATKVLMGLRYPKEQVDEFERGVSAMIFGWFIVRPRCGPS
jgi:hypothetical protein